jgi:hypothetical protein
MSICSDDSMKLKVPCPKCGRHYCWLLEVEEAIAVEGVALGFTGVTHKMVYERAVKRAFEILGTIVSDDLSKDELPKCVQDYIDEMYNKDIDEMAK